MFTNTLSEQTWMLPVKLKYIYMSFTLMPFFSMLPVSVLSLSEAVVLLSVGVNSA